MYADRITRSMKLAIDETNRRREIQKKYNLKNNITPKSVASEISEGLRAIIPQKDKKLKLDLRKIPREEWDNLIQDLTNQMNLASANLLFEEAADLRDQIAEIRKRMVK